MDFDKHRGWNKRGGWNIFMILLWRVKFFKISKRDVTFIRQMRVDHYNSGTTV